LVWGIVPTNWEPFAAETADSLEIRQLRIWAVLEDRGIERELLLARSMLSPATCCLVNPDGERTVEKAFAMTKKLSLRLRERLNLL
ncbi:MAG TPA: hypothetical protein VMS77_07915, partial [Conexivisphaerales archaeon]|nr:hypothetical protein [Conexivisphaerales archaeon]